MFLFRKKMKIIVGNPPNIDEIRKVFPVQKNVVFAYGDAIYNPDNLRVPHEAILHEQVHQRQQKKIGTKIWWDKYLADVEFRIAQEIPAFKAQCDYMRKQLKNPKQLQWYLARVAEAMSGDNYGNCISFKDALKYISQ